MSYGITRGGYGSGSWAAAWVGLGRLRLGYWFLAPWVRLNWWHWSTRYGVNLRVWRLGVTRLSRETWARFRATGDINPADGQP